MNKIEAEITLCEALAFMESESGAVVRLALSGGIAVRYLNKSERDFVMALTAIAKWL